MTWTDIVATTMDSDIPEVGKMAHRIGHHSVLLYVSHHESQRTQGPNNNKVGDNGGFFQSVAVEK